jgi:hypothetical protein
VRKHKPSSAKREKSEISAAVMPTAIDSVELARRLNLPTSWVRNQVRSRASDPIPHFRFGRYVRFEWNSPELKEWLERRRNAA